MQSSEHLRKIEYFKDRDLSYSFDSLTQVLNRQTMIEYIDSLIKSGKAFSLFLIDIDNFKNVNDTYGHLVGDAVLKQAAEHFVDRVAIGNGVVARYGGDEFMIVFEGASEYETVWKYGHEIDANMGELVFDGTLNLSITVSIGIARSPLDAVQYEELFTVADKALYRAKMKGRNCFVIYMPEKHANILLRGRDKQLTNMQLISTVFSNLTAGGEDITAAINAVFRSLVSHFMYDHICIETENGMNFSFTHSLAAKHDFAHIDYNLISNTVNQIGYISLKYTGAPNGNSFDGLLAECKRQSISSALYCKISAYGKDYGIIRIDTVNTVRIWQNSEISIVMVAANAIGMLLHYQNKTLDDLPQTGHGTVADEE